MDDIKFTNDLFSSDVKQTKQTRKLYEHSKSAKIPTNISINIGSLDKGTNDIENKSVYKVDK